MREVLYDISRGSLIRQTYGDSQVYSIREPISRLMEKIEGAELVSAQWMQIGDAHQMIYFISPEGACVHFDAQTQVRIMGFASNADALSRVKQRMRVALG